MPPSLFPLCVFGRINTMYQFIANHIRQTDHIRMIDECIQQVSNYYFRRPHDNILFIYSNGWEMIIMDSIPGAYTDLLISKFVCFHRFKWPTDVDNDSILLDPVNLWLDCGQHSVWGAIKQDIGSRNNNLWVYICKCTPPAVVSHHNKHTSSLIVLSRPSSLPSHHHHHHHHHMVMVVAWCLAVDLVCHGNSRFH